MSPHSDTLSWFQANQSLFFLLNAAYTYLVEKQQIPIFYRTRREYPGANSACKVSLHGKSVLKKRIFLSLVTLTLDETDWSPKVALGDHDKGSEQQQENKSTGIKSIIFSNIFSLFYINLYFHLDFKIYCIHIYSKTVTRYFFFHLKKYIATYVFNFICKINDI
jgi:hypothetical protein